MPETTTISLPHIDSFKIKALHWANQFNVVCMLDSNNYPQKYSSKEWLLAVDALDEIKTDLDSVANDSLTLLKQFQLKTAVNIFGLLSYDLKNEIEKLESSHTDHLKFPLLYFFKPRYLLEINENKLTVNRNYPETFELIERINQYSIPDDEYGTRTKIKLTPRTQKEKYLQNVESIRQQILAGDFYELNYCNEFYAEQTTIQPVETFLRLNKKAKAPFSAFFKLKDKYLLCASPERFLNKNGNRLISQPIKGTKRKGNTVQDNEQLKQQLQTDTKERAENVMIVDLTRNDLARSSKPGTVQVEELFGVYEFNTVHQMISTVLAESQNGIHFTDIIKNSFPMGSMTGAPKIEVMKNIDHYEDFKRSIYSGSVGYITPVGDFDLNVVIRSILYNETEKFISVRSGGAITFDSDAENEWQEILLKAESMIAAL